MLDTIVLMLPEHAFRLHHPERFSPNATTMRSYVSRGVFRAFYNPTTEESRAGYKPRLTLYRQPTGVVGLKVEFSAPKMVFANNFEELKGAGDLERVIPALLSALDAMGVVTTSFEVRAAPVRAIHYSKNVLLERTTPCWLLIQALQKLDVSQKLDLAHTTFRNGGVMAKYHATNYEITLYDKVKDLEHAAKFGDRRGAEKDYRCQSDLFARHPEKPEVLRFEVRLTARKIKTLFPRLRIERPLTLPGLFGSDASRAVLLHYWQEVTDSLFAHRVDTRDAAALIQRIRAAFPNKRPGKVCELTGFAVACQGVGLRGARLALGLKPHQFYRLRRDLKTLDAHATHPRFSVLAAVKAELVEFLPLTKADLGLTGMLD